MMISLVLTPDVFDPSHFDDPVFYLNAEQLLQGINSNGLILVDTDDVIYNMLCDNVERLSATRKGKRSQIFFEELLKKQRQNQLRFVRSSCTVNSEEASEQQICSLAKRCNADAFIVQSGERISATANSEITIAVSDYVQSEIESQRRSFAEADLLSCDEMSNDEFRKLIVKATRFSKCLRFYDKMLGKGDGLHRFRRGIERIVQIWTDNAYFPRTELAIEIYTVVDDGRYRRFSPSEAYSQARREIREPLYRRFRMPVSLSFKLDRNYISHPRHLQTDSITIQFERGFDFLNNNGSMRRMFLNLVRGGDHHLAEYRQLPDFDPMNP